MADEFMKGFAIFIVCGLLWIVLSGWYNTAGFEAAQLLAETQGAGTLYDQIGYVLREGFFWAAVLGPVTFWLIIPAVKEFRNRTAN
jgi:TM2 domain-containing membrane protein YozV